MLSRRRMVRMSDACHCDITPAAPMSLRMRRSYRRMMNALMREHHRYHAGLAMRQRGKAEKPARADNQSIVALPIHSARTDAWMRSSAWRCIKVLTRFSPSRPCRWPSLVLLSRLLLGAPGRLFALSLSPPSSPSYPRSRPHNGHQLMAHGTVPTACVSTWCVQGASPAPPPTCAAPAVISANGPAFRPTVLSIRRFHLL